MQQGMMLHPHVLRQVKLPGRCTMQELLEYSRRNTAVQGGKSGKPRGGGALESSGCDIQLME